MKKKPKILWAKQTCFLAPYPSGHFESQIQFEQNFTTGSKLDVLGVVRILVKYELHLSKRKNLETNIFLFTCCSNTKQPIFGLKEF
jgi:hypothetical protein